jgi:dethiobiotin synthase
MLRGLFVTGTDTGIGKTVVSAALMPRYRAEAPLCYWKPIQTGIEQDDDTETVRMLGGCTASEIHAEGIRLPRPLSPHLAARLSGERIEPQQLKAMIQALPTGCAWIIEGAGGALVPLNDSDMMTDLMQWVGLPVLVAARSGLGTINHTLLTLEALRARSLTVAGVVMVGEPNAENRAAIEKYGRAPVVAEAPCLTPLSADTLAHWARENFDPEGSLARYFHG